MGRKPHPRHVVAAVAVALAMVLGGCGRAVMVSPADVSGEDAGRCAAMGASLPDTLVGEPRVETVPDPATTAAWGAPAIVWRCGVGEPASLGEGVQLLAVDGVEWLPEPLSRGTRFTRLTPQPRVEVTIPAAYGGAAAVLAELQEAEPQPAGSQGPSDAPNPG